METNRVRKQFGKRVREAREEYRLTQEELGDRFGCSQRTISDIERGVTSVGVDDLPRLARVLRKDVFYFYPNLTEQLDPGSLHPDVASIVQRLSTYPPERFREVVDWINNSLDVLDRVEE